MKRKLKSGHTRLKTKFGLPDLEHAKIAVTVPRVGCVGRILRSMDHAMTYFTFEDTLSQIGFGYPETVPENLRLDDTLGNLFITNSRSSGAVTYGRETLLMICHLGIAQTTRTNEERTTEVEIRVFSSPVVEGCSNCRPVKLGG